MDIHTIFKFGFGSSFLILAILILLARRSKSGGTTCALLQLAKWLRDAASIVSIPTACYAGKLFFFSNLAIFTPSELTFQINLTLYALTLCLSIFTASWAAIIGVGLCNYLVAQFLQILRSRAYALFNRL